MIRPLLAAALLLAPSLAPAAEGRSHILGGLYDGTLENIQGINLLVGADALYARGFFGQNALVANVEAGHVWGGHEVFARGGLGLPDAPTVLFNAARDALAAPDLGDLDYHATMVGHMLAGTGYLEGGDLSLLGAGIAPLAELHSGAIATRFDRSEEGLGAFEISNESFDVVYRTFFRGSLGRRPDAINSSWGFADPAGIARENRVLDALAGENPTVAFVRSAGNGGPTAAPGTGFNGIVVGGLGGASDPQPYRTPAEFTAGAAGDFHHPVTGETLVGVRASVALAAPAEQLALAFYGGKSGSLADLVGEGIAGNDLYFTFNADGTSFSAPAVAGGIALLKDAAYGTGLAIVQPESLDTRVVKSVLQAGASETVGWTNAQHLVDGVIITTQALDFAVGAGAMDLATSAAIYLDGTQDVAGMGGGVLASLGWDLGAVSTGQSNNYAFADAFAGPVELTLSLNWFLQSSLTPTGADFGSFANLDLGLWRLETDGTFGAEIARSATSYGNSEFLRLMLEPGRYGVRVSLEGWIYDLSGAATQETYGLAWSVTAVPEPAAAGALTALLLGAILWTRRRKIVVARASRG